MHKKDQAMQQYARSQNKSVQHKITEMLDVVQVDEIYMQAFEH